MKLLILVILSVLWASCGRQEQSKEVEVQNTLTCISANGQTSVYYLQNTSDNNEVIPLQQINLIPSDKCKLGYSKDIIINR